MDKRIYLLLGVIVLLEILRRKYKSIYSTDSPDIKAKKDLLKSLYKRETVFLCDWVDDMGDNIFQFYGEPFGISARPNMKILVNGIEYRLKEVYADDKTPDKPDLEITNGMTNTAIVIEATNFNWARLHQDIKRDKVVALKLY